MNILKQFVSGLGQQNAPFGFAPDNPNASYQAGLSYIGDIGANLMANNQPGVNPWANLGASLQQAKATSVDRNRQQYTAQQLMEEAAARKAEKEQAAQRQQWMDEQIAQLPREQQALARMMPDKFFGAQIEQRFAKPKEMQKPAAIQEYEYAKAQGFGGTFQDWEASKKGGMSLSVDPATGQVTFQQGSNIKPMTEAQSKDTVYATRAEGALKALEPVAESMTGLRDTIASKVPFGNYAKSNDYQKAEQAGREFLQAILRKDTGAAITKDEMSEYGSVFLPAPGDGPDVLLQKKASRRRAVEALHAGMTPQAILAKERALMATGDNMPSAAPGNDDPLGLR